MAAPAPASAPPRAKKATTVLPIKRWSECSQCALCEKTCEWGAIRKRQILKTECVRCDDCEILYDDKARCRTGCSS